jgi:hypothetical protein
MLALLPLALLVLVLLPPATEAFLARPPPLAPGGLSGLRQSR